MHLKTWNQLGYRKPHSVLSITVLISNLCPFELCTLSWDMPVSNLRAAQHTQWPNGFQMLCGIQSPAAWQTTQIWALQRTLLYLGSSFQCLARNNTGSKAARAWENSKVLCQPFHTPHHPGVWLVVSLSSSASMISGASADFCSLQELRQHL